MKSFFVFSLSLLFPLFLFSQFKMKFGKIPAEDLEMTTYAGDPDADAVVLGEKAALGFEFNGEATQTRLEVHRRIKILKRAGFDQGDVSLYYYNYQKKGKITGLKVKVINPDGSEHSLKNSEIFDEEVNQYYSAKKFSAPGLQEGSVIDYKYNLYSENIFTLQRWYFQKEIPVKYSEYSVKIPEWYQYVELMNSGAIQRDAPEEREESITYNRGGARGGSGNATVKFVTTRYYAENLPGLKPEPFVTTMEDYLANIQFQLSTVQFPLQPVERVLTTWEKVAQNLTESESFGRQYLNFSNFNAVARAAEPAFEGAETETDIIRAAYDFVLSNIENDGTAGFSVNGSLNRIFERKSGSAGEMNLMLLALLRQKDIKAVPVLLSTRENGKVVEVYPIVSQFDHMVVAAVVDEEIIYLDATEKGRPINYLGTESLNKRAWMMSETPGWIDIKPRKSKKILLANLTLNETGDLNGDLNVSSQGYESFSEKINAKNDTENEGKYWLEMFSEKYPDAELSEVTYEGTERSADKLKVAMDCSLPAAAQVSGDLIYLNPIIYAEFDENPFKIENRLYPVEITYPFQEQLIVNVALPEGYAVEEIPEQVSLALPNKGGKYQYLISQKENSLQIIRKFRLSQLTFLPQEYPGIKDFFGRMIEKENAQIVLKKI